MNILKGLIKKDILQLKSYRKTLLIFFAVFVISAIANKDILSSIQMLTVMLTLIFGMMGIATFSYDQMSKADRYMLTFPLTKKEIVKSKYILTLGLSCIGAIIGLLLSFIILHVMKTPTIDIQELISVALGGIFGIGIIIAIQIPCIYKWGVEKGRMQIYVIALIISLIGGLVAYVGQKTNINLPMNTIINALNNFLPIILVVLIAIIYYVSYRISYKIYLKKEI